jgi:hypothetical protein
MNLIKAWIAKVILRWAGYEPPVIYIPHGSRLTLIAQGAVEFRAGKLVDAVPVILNEGTLDFQGFPTPPRIIRDEDKPS